MMETFRQFIIDWTGITSPIGPQVVLSLGVLVIALVVWLAVRRWIRKQPGEEPQIAYRLRLTNAVVWLMAVLLILATWLEGEEVSVSSMLSRFNEILTELTGWSEYSAQINKTILIVVVVTIIRWILLRIINRQVADITQQYYWRRAVKYSTGILMLLFIGSVWFAELGKNLGTFLGLVSAGLAIAMQDPLVNLAGWLFILVRRPYKVGDRIEINDRIGDVIDIRLFQTYLLECGNWVEADQSTGRIIMIPNGMVFKSVTGNYTLDFEYIWDEIPVLVTFESDWKKAKEILTEIANEHARPLSEGAEQQIRRAAAKHMIFYSKLTPIVYTDVRDSGVMLTIRYMTKPRNRRGNAQRVWEAILEAFAQESSIDFAYPSMRYYLNYIEGKENAKAPIPSAG